MAKRVFEDSYGAGSSKRAAISSSGGLVLCGLPQVETKYPAATDKVCIVCSFSLGSAYQYGIFFLDIKSCEVQNNLYPAIEPSIVLDHSFPKWMTFSLRKHRLFMFGGHELDTMAMKAVSKSSVFAYDIGPTTTQITLSKDSVEVLPSMRAGKRNPFAAVVGDKICVFPYLIAESDISAFELFDPVTEVWTALPQIPEAKSPDLIGTMKVAAYSVQENNLLISTGNKNIYLINLEQSSEFVWISLVVEWMYKSPATDFSHIPPHSNAPDPVAPPPVGFPFAGGSLMLEDVCFTPLSAVFMQPYMGVPVPLFFLPSHGEQSQADPLIYCKRGLEISPIRGDSSIVCLGERRLCIAKVGLKDLGDELGDELSCPYLLLDAFNFKSLSSGENKSQKARDFDFGFGLHLDLQDEYSENLEITALTSSKYELTGNKCILVGIGGFFAM